MSKTKIFRALALLNFIVLVIVFLLYRNGAFDNTIHHQTETTLTSTNGGTQAATKDTLPIKQDTSKSSTLLPSSKSITVIDIGKAKGIYYKPSKPVTDSGAARIRAIMYGSKSGKIFEPTVSTKDTTQKKNVQQTQKQQ